jgi:hypothetical protein
MSEVIGQGRLVIPSGIDFRHIGFKISRQTINLYDLSEPVPISSLDWWPTVAQELLLSPSSETVSVNGHVVLSALPAQPQAAFFDLDIGGSPTSFSLVVKQSGSFASSPTGHVTFQNLNITFTHIEGEPEVKVTGHVEALLFAVFDQPIKLLPTWLEDGRLSFKAEGSEVSLGSMGDLINTHLVLDPVNHPWDALQLAYSFETGSFDVEPGHGADPVIRDISGKAPIDLVIHTPSKVEGKDNSLVIGRDNHQGVEIATAPLASPPPLSGEPRPINRLIEACKTTNEISVVLWIEPNSKSYSDPGPGRLITLSSGINNRNFLIGRDNDGYVARLRTTETDNNGQSRGKNPLKSGQNSVKLEPTCIVLTRSAVKDDDNKNTFLYINGQLVNSAYLGGNFQPTEAERNKQKPEWENFELALANEFGKDESKGRSWGGTFYRVEVYNKALSKDQVHQLSYPRVTTVGQLQLTGMPVPLNIPLEAVVTYEKDHSVIEAKALDPREVTPQFWFNAIQLSWKKTSPNPDPDEVRQDPWVLQSDSVINAKLWENNTFSLKPQPGDVQEPGALESFLPLVSEPKSLALSLGSLGSLTANDFQLRPKVFDDRFQWELTTRVRETNLILPPLPSAPKDRPFDERVYDFKTDFRLESPELAVEFIEDEFRGIQEDRVVLKGKWLGQTIGFYGLSMANQFMLRGVTEFLLPFSLTLGPIYEPGTALLVTDQVTMHPEPGYRQIMKINTLVDLTASGFMAVVNSTFPWHDGVGEQTLSVPPFTTFTLPTTPNALLAEVIDKLELDKDRIFAPFVRSAKDFYVRPVSPDTPESYMVIYGSLDTPENPDSSISPVGLGSIKELLSKFSLALTKEEAETLSVLKQGLAGLLAQDETVKQSYKALLKLVSTSLADKTNGVYQFEAIRRYLATVLPVPIDKALRYAYGYDGGQNIDLLGGMRLRVEYQNYQFVHPMDQTAESGFVSSGTAYYSLQFHQVGNSSYLSFDPFLSKVPTQGSGAKSGVAGLIDLLQAQSNPFYRLLYPDKLAAGEGRIGRERATVLLGAKTYHELEEATDQYTRTQSVPSNVDVIHFRGRAVVIPEIAIFVQEQPVYVTVGTTLQQLAERYGYAALKGRAQRLVYEGQGNSPTYRLINLGNAAKALDLPLMQGDRVVF